MEPWCGHKDFDSSCSECLRCRENDIEKIEKSIEKAYEEGGLRGVTHYVLSLRH